jgi:p-aminobenzoyl-glutamate transporter AbgT
MTDSAPPQDGRKGLVATALGWIERVGNKLPDPAMLFLIALLLVWAASAVFSGHEFSVPAKDGSRTLSVANQLTGASFANFLATMVTNFTGFAPLGVVLVAILGVGVAEQTGFINATLKGLISVTPKMLLSPMLILVAIVSHTAADAGYVLVIPLGGIIFHAAGRQATCTRSSSSSRSTSTPSPARPASS